MINTFLFTWINMKIKKEDNDYNIYHIGPTSVSVNGTWYFLTQTIHWNHDIFGSTYWTRNALDILIVAAVHNVGVLFCVIIYGMSLIMHMSNIDRYNWLVLFATILFWVIIILVKSLFSKISFGFYIQLLLLFLGIIVQLHYMLMRKRLQRKLLINQLLEA